MFNQHILQHHGVHCQSQPKQNIQSIQLRNNISGIPSPSFELYNIQEPSIIINNNQKHMYNSSHQPNLQIQTQIQQQTQPHVQFYSQPQTQTQIQLSPQPQFQQQLQTKQYVQNNFYEVNRGKEILSQNPTLSTSDISSILEDEWTHLEPNFKNYNINEATDKRKTIDKEHSDYNLNNIKKRRYNENDNDNYNNDNKSENDSTNNNYSSINPSNVAYQYNLNPFNTMHLGDSSVSIRQPPNAFIIFNRRIRPCVRKENPDLSVAEISKIISKRWKSLSEEEKKMYYDESKRLRNEYNIIKKLKKDDPNNNGNSNTISISLPINDSKFSPHSIPYPSPKSSPKNNFNYLGYQSHTSFPKIRYRTPKDPTQPKHPSSAFIFYLRDARPKYIAQYPTKSLGFISKLISIDWKNLSDAEKAIYIKKSEEDKKRYSIEMEKWTESRKKESDNKQ